MSFVNRRPAAPVTEGMRTRGWLVAAVLTPMLAAACSSGSGTVAQDTSPQPLLSGSSPSSTAASAAPVATHSTHPATARATTAAATHPATTAPAVTRTTSKPAPKPTAKRTAKPKPTSTAAKGCAVSGKTAALKMVDQLGSPGQFSPREVDIHCGTKVTVTNTSSTDHTWTGNTWDSGNVATNASYSYVFRFAGTYSFVCSYHPNMTGKVVVSAA